MKKLKLLRRILSSPFVFCIILIAYFVGAVKRFILFLKYGGELITYVNDEPPTIRDIYMELKRQRDNHFTTTKDE